MEEPAHRVGSYEVAVTYTVDCPMCEGTSVPRARICFLCAYGKVPEITAAACRLGGLQAASDIDHDVEMRVIDAVITNKVPTIDKNVAALCRSQNNIWAKRRATIRQKGRWDLKP